MQQCVRCLAECDPGPDNWKKCPYGCSAASYDPEYPHTKSLPAGPLWGSKEYPRSRMPWLYMMAACLGSIEYVCDPELRRCPEYRQFLRDPFRTSSAHIDEWETARVQVTHPAHTSLRHLVISLEYLAEIQDALNTVLHVLPHVPTYLIALHERANKDPNIREELVAIYQKKIGGVNISTLSQPHRAIYVGLACTSPLLPVEVFWIWATWLAGVADELMLSATCSWLPGALVPRPTPPAARTKNWSAAVAPKSASALSAQTKSPAK